MNSQNDLVMRLRDYLVAYPGNLAEKKMMGGLCFLLNGNMVGGAGCNESGDACYMFRVGKENSKAAELLAGGQPLIKGGRPMGGMYLVDAHQPDSSLDEWINLAASNALSLPPK